MAAPDVVVSTEDKLALVTAYWSPKVIAETNGWEVKLVKVAGEFVPHEHADVDEVFLVLAGALSAPLGSDGRPDVALRTGDLFVVPRGVVHQPVARAECHLMLLEPGNVVNTGDSGGPLTAQDEWI